MSTSTWVIGIMTATALVGLALILLIRILSPGDEVGLVAVPEVRGATVEAATTALTDAGFEVTPSEVPDPEIAAGLAVGTDPAAGTELDRGSPVTLLVSTGPSSVDVPNLLNLSLDEARSILLSAGLTLGDIDFEVSPVVPADTVLSQDPMPGTTVEAGSAVSIVISAGTDAIEMPNVVGRSEADALFQLGQAGFQADQVVVQEQPDAEVLEGFVIATVPEAGQMVASTSTITIIVSSGIGPIEVPDVVGMDLTTATAVLQAAGFEVEQGDVIEVPFGDENDGLVMEQDPAAGTELEEGETVTIRVGASGEAIDVPNLIDVDQPLTLAEAEAILEGLGLVLEQGPDVEVEFGSDFDGRVAEQSPPPGTQVGIGDTVIVSLGKAVEGVEVPDVVGLGDNEAQAENRIELAGLVYEYDAALDITVPFGDPRDGIAADTDPDAGTIVAPGTTIRVGFYREQGTTVPDILDKIRPGPGGADQTIVDAGLVVDYLGTCDPPGAQTIDEGRVVAQWPAAGTVVAPGSEVSYYLYQAGAGACTEPS